MPPEISNLLHLLENCPTSWHTVEYLKALLEKEGFVSLEESDSWNLKSEGKYFVSRGGSFSAFVLPKQNLEKALILGAHTDSPGFKLKPNAEYSVKNMVMWGVETYGSPLLNSWLNRDLGIAGRVVLRNHLSRNIFIKQAPIVIPQLAVHLDRDVNEKGLHLNKQEHLTALASIKHGTPYLEKLLKEACDGELPLSSDLFLVPLEAPRLSEQMINSYRLDNLVSVSAAINALNRKPSNDCLQMVIFWDHEEIGSHTREGADSPFLKSILERIAFCSKFSQEDLYRLHAKSLCISLDMAHALHPNYLDKHEPRHQPQLGEGIVLKSNANHRYATDAISAAKIVEICQTHHIPFQYFVARSDMPCGSTIGPLVASRTGIKTVDIGCPQLSMHSIREVISTKDYLAMCSLLKAMSC